MIADGRPCNVIANKDQHRLEQVPQPPLGPVAVGHLVGQPDEHHGNDQGRDQLQQHELREAQLERSKDTNIVDRLDPRLAIPQRRVFLQQRLGQLDFAPRHDLGRNLDHIRVLHVAEQMARIEYVVGHR